MSRTLDNSTRLVTRIRGLPCRVMASSIFQRVDSARAPRKVVAILGGPSCVVRSVLNKGGPLIVVLRSLRSPKGTKAVLHAKRNTKMDKILLAGAYISVAGPGIVQSAVNSICEVPFLCIRDIMSLTRRLGSEGVHAFTTRLRNGGSCSRRSCAKKATFLVNGRKGKLASRTTSDTSYLVQVPVYKGMRSLGTTVTSKVLVCRTTHREQ